MRRQRRLGADQAARALEAFQQRGFLAADIGAGADPHFEVEACAEPPMSAPRQPALAAAAIASFIVAMACGYSERM